MAALPPIPGDTKLPSPVPGVGENKSSGTPVLAGLPTTTTTNSKATTTTTKTTAVANPLADLPPPLPEATENVSVGQPITLTGMSPQTTEIVPPAVELPSLNLAPPPLPGVDDVGSVQSFNGSPPPKLAPIALPAPPTVSKIMKPVQVTVAEEKPKIKSWKTKLEPAYKPVETNFNYRRVQQPPILANNNYNRDNQHLPKIYSRDDYANLLFITAAQNNVDAVRALLNAGTSANVTDANGETPLSVARRSGATATAELLAARGGRI